MKQNTKRDAGPIPKWRAILGHGFQVASLCSLTLANIALPYLLTSSVPKTFSIRSAVEISIFTGTILAVFGLIFVGLARWAAKEVMWARHYIIALIAIIIVQDAVAALGAFILFR